MDLKYILNQGVIMEERAFKKGTEKMTVVDTLQSAFAKQDISKENIEYLNEFFQGKINYKKITKDDIERLFAILREVTDKVALMNSPYPSEIDLAFKRLEEYWMGLKTINLDYFSGEIRLLFLSHLTFHRETINDIISEARELLIEERRLYLKKLVNYQKEFSSWLRQIEKTYL